MTNIEHRNTAIRSEVRAIWKLSWPMMVGQLATVGMGVADVAMTGHKGAADLAAVSLGASLWAMVIVTVMGIMMAINPVVAHEIGAGRHDKIPHVVRQALWKGLFIGVLASLFLNGATLVFDYLQLDPEVHATASRFVHVISLGLPALAMYRALQGYSTSVNQTKPIMLIALGGLAFNIIGNTVLIWGLGGFPELGAVGCATSTAAGLWLMLGAMVLWIRHAPAYKQTYPFTCWEAPHWPEIGKMLKMGLPIGVTYFAEVSAFASVGLLVARFGVVQTAAHQIALNFSSVVFMVPMSVGIALITRVGQALGEGNAQRARFVGWVGISMSLVFAAASAFCIFLFRWQIAAAYTSDAAVQVLAVDLLVMAAIFQLSDATQTAASSAIRGYKVTRPPMLIHLLAFWGLAIPLGVMLGLAPVWLFWSPAEPLMAHGFWIGLTIGLSVAAVLLAWYYARISQRHVHAAAKPALARQNKAA
jgi:MATE family multidrug resistance protein